MAVLQEYAYLSFKYCKNVMIYFTHACLQYVSRRAGILRLTFIYHQYARCDTHLKLNTLTGD